MLDNKNLRVPIRALSQIQLGGGGGDGKSDPE